MKRVVEFNDENNTLGKRWFALQDLVFSKSDQCLSVVDPLQRLIDAIQSGSLENDRTAANYILRRIPFDPSQSTEENVRRTMLRSFAAFVAQRRGDTKKFETGLSAMAELEQRNIQPTEIEKHPWLTSLATETGIDADALLAIHNRMSNFVSDWDVAACLRHGVDLLAKLAVLHLSVFEINRVRVHRIFEEISEHLQEGELNETFTQTKKRARKAMKKSGYL